MVWKALFHVLSRKIDFVKNYAMKCAPIANMQLMCRIFPYHAMMEIGAPLLHGQPKEYSR